MRSLAPPRRRTIGPLSAIDFAASSEAPVIVCLHGYGADAADLASLAQEVDLARPVRWIFPDAPLRMSAFMPGKAWFAIDQERMQSVQFEGKAIDLAAGRPLGLDEAVATVSEFLKALAVPVERLILGGFSQGAMVALELTLGAPRTPLGLFLMSTALVDEAALAARAAARGGMKFFQSHGSHDPLLSFDGARRLHAALVAAGWTGEKVIFDGGHGVTREVLDGLAGYLDSLPRPEAK